MKVSDCCNSKSIGRRYINFEPSSILICGKCKKPCEIREDEGA